MWKVLDHLILFAWDLHPYYAASGVVLVLALITIGYFKFRIPVGEGYWVYYNPIRPPLRGPGTFFMPYEHSLIPSLPNVFFVGLDELLVTSQVEVTERGDRNQWQRTVNSNRDTSSDKFIVTWSPNPERLSDLMKRPHPAMKGIQEILRDALRADPDIDLQKFADKHTLGILASVQRPSARKKTGGSVWLAHDVEIPYEG